MTERSKRQTAKTKPAGIAYAGDLPEEARQEIAAKMERITKGLKLSPGRAPEQFTRVSEGFNFNPVVKLPKGHMAKTFVQLLDGLVSDIPRLSKFWEGLAPDQEEYIKTLFTKMRISVLRGDYLDVLPMLDDLIKIIEALKPKEDLVSEAMNLRSNVEDLIGKLDKDLLPEERAVFKTQSAGTPEGKRQQQEEKTMEGLREELEKAIGARGYVSPSRATKKALTGYFSEEVVNGVRDIAAMRRMKVQDVLNEAMNDLLAKHADNLQRYQKAVRDFIKD